MAEIPRQVNWTGGKLPYNKGQANEKFWKTLDELQPVMSQQFSGGYEFGGGYAVLLEGKVYAPPGMAGSSKMFAAIIVEELSQKPPHALESASNITRWMVNRIVKVGDWCHVVIECDVHA